MEIQSCPVLSAAYRLYGSYEKRCIELVSEEIKALAEPLLEELIISVMKIAFQLGHCGPQRLGRQCPQSPLAKAQNLTHLRELE